MYIYIYYGGSSDFFLELPPRHEFVTEHIHIDIYIYILIYSYTVDRHMYIYICIYLGGSSKIFLELPLPRHEFVTKHIYTCICIYIYIRFIYRTCAYIYMHMYTFMETHTTALFYLRHKTSVGSPN